jgi:hypothetical protein
LGGFFFHPKGKEISQEISISCPFDTDLNRAIVECVAILKSA